jgi:hypothetical protein
MPFDAETLVRAAAVVAAVALLAAPYWGRVAGWLASAAEAAGKHRATLGRIAAAGLIVAAAWGRVPLPSLQPAAVPSVTVPTPSPALQASVGPIALALEKLPPADRALWAATWAKAALVVEAEGATAVAVFTDTPALRTFTTTTLDIAWRRIGGHAPGSVAGLREAVEASMRSALGLAAVPVTPDVRARYAEVARAIAWAGTR